MTTGGSVEHDDPVWMRQPGPHSLVEIHAVSGPGAGRVWPLGMGVHDIGSAPGSTIEILGDGAPERGVQVKIGPSGQAWLMLPEAGGQRNSGKQGSAVRVNVVGPSDGCAAARCVTGEIPWPADGDLVLGSAVLHITSPSAADAAAVRSRDGYFLDFSRPPRALATPVPVDKFQMPHPPAIPPRPTVPVAMIALILLEIGIARLRTSPFLSAVALFTSVIAVLAWLGQRHLARRTFAHDLRAFQDRRTAVNAALLQTTRKERAGGCDTLIDPARAALTAIGPGRRLWERRRGDPDYLVLRVGTMNQPSMTEIEDPAPDGTGRISGWVLPDAPLGLHLNLCGIVGLAGEIGVTRAVASWMVVQAAILHSPRDLRIVLLDSEPGQAAWEWIRRLPHVSPASERNGRAAIIDRDPRHDDIAELVSLIRARVRTEPVSSARWREPDIIVVVDGARRLPAVTALAQVLAEGPARRIFSICLDEQERWLPEECTTVIHCGPDALTVRQQGQAGVSGIRPDLVSLAWCDRVARCLAAVRDVTPG